jgi:hypothetical protein
MRQWECRGRHGPAAERDPVREDVANSAVMLIIVAWGEVRIANQNETLKPLALGVSS